ncbi:PRC-barrel domain-containing protein [Poseidonocella sedimentorum]|nr:PRC-barrel domain-containing protein [Poseidonocella sedimentorum]
MAQTSLSTDAQAGAEIGAEYGATDNQPFVQQSQQTDLFGSELIGKSLYVSEANMAEPGEEFMQDEWDNVGEISDLLLSTDGSVKAVLLDIGGFLGMGEKTVAVNMDELNIVQDANDAEDYFVTTNATRESLESAPEFERMEAGWWHEQQDILTEGEADRTAQSEVEPMDGTTAADMTETDRVAQADRTGEDAPMMWDRPANEYAGYTEVKADELTAEDLQGAPIYGSNDEHLGEVADLTVAEDGTIEKSIVDVGGFLGLGEHRIAIAFDEMKIMRDADGGDLRVYVGATQEQLEERPEYEY